MLSLLQSADDVIDLAAGERYLLASEQGVPRSEKTSPCCAESTAALDLDPRREDASEIATYGSAAVMKGLAPPLSLSLSLAMKRIGAIRRKPYERAERM